MRNIRLQTIDKQIGDSACKPSLTILLCFVSAAALTGCNLFESSYACSNHESALYADKLSLTIGLKKIVVGSETMKECKKLGNVIYFVRTDVQCEGPDMNNFSYQRYKFDEVTKVLGVTHLYPAYESSKSDPSGRIAVEKVTGGFAYNCINAK